MRRAHVILVTLLVTATAVLVSGPARHAGPRWPSVDTARPIPRELQPLLWQTLNEDADGTFAFAAALDDQTRFVATNRRHGFTASFGTDGVEVDAGSRPLTLQLIAFGRESALRPAAAGPWRADGAVIERYATSSPRTAIREWYVNGPLGLEQGFTIASAPAGQGAIAIELAVSAPWTVLPTADASALRLHDSMGEVTLSYAGLYAFDAKQQPLRARLTSSRDRIVVTVDADDSATYPITIDPFIQQQTLSAFDGEPGDSFGFSVDLQADTAVIGARDRESSRGAAYVFVRSGTTWSLQAKLVPNDPAPARFFGHDVAISGNTIAVGAFNGQRAEPGSTYVFVRSGTVWTQQAKLTASDASISDFFGVAVALDGETLAVGAPGPGNDATDRPGAAYVFVRAGTVWSLQQRLQPGDLNAADNFGAGVALSGGTLIAGAPRHDDGAALNSGRAYVFVRAGTIWSEQQTLAPNPPVPSLFFGSATAVAGDRALLGGASFVNVGLALAFERSGTTWAQRGRFELPAVSAFGSRADIDGATGILGSTGAQLLGGGVTLVRFRDNAPPVAETIATRIRGRAVAIQGATILVGEAAFFAPGEADVLVDVSGPPPPPVVSPPIVTGSTVDLSWSPSAGATRYQVRAGTSPGGSNAFNGDVGNTTTIKAVNVPNGSYFVRVFAVNGSGESAASNEVRVDVGVPGPCTTPVAPQNLSQSVNNRLVSLTWNASTGATSYVVEAGSANGLANLAVIDTGSPTPGLLANAPPGTYFVRVRAKNSCGLSPPSNQVTVTVN